jgi:4-hydroxymandelate oxidase
MSKTRRDLLKTITALTIPFSGRSQSTGQNQSQITTGDPVDLSEIINLYDFEKMRVSLLLIPMVH